MSTKNISNLLIFFILEIFLFWGNLLVGMDEVSKMKEAGRDFSLLKELAVKSTEKEAWAVGPRLIDRCHEHVNGMRRLLYPKKTGASSVAAAHPFCLRAIQTVLQQSSDYLTKGKTTLLRLERSSNSRESYICASAELLKSCSTLENLFAIFKGVEQGAPDVMQGRTVDRSLVCLPHDSSALLLLDFMLQEPVPEDHASSALCVECDGCPAEMWCPACKQKSLHANKTSVWHTMRDNIIKYVGIDQPERYLATRIGKSSSTIDTWLADALEKTDGFSDTASEVSQVSSDVLESSTSQADEAVSTEALSSEEKNIAYTMLLMYRLGKNLSMLEHALKELPDNPSQSLLEILKTKPGQVRFAEGVYEAERDPNWFRCISAYLVNRYVIGKANRQALESARQQLPPGTRLTSIVEMVHGFIADHGLQSQLPFITSLLKKYGGHIDTSLQACAHYLKGVDALTQRVAINQPRREVLLGVAVSSYLEKIASAWRGDPPVWCSLGGFLKPQKPEDSDESETKSPRLITQVAVIKDIQSDERE